MKTRHLLRSLLALLTALLTLAPLATHAASPAAGTWALTGSPRHARLGQTTTLLPDGDVLLAGGNNTSNFGTILASAELYHPGTGAWTATGSMHTARAFGTATLLPGGKVLVVGGAASFPAGSGCGICATDILASAELYNPRTGVWLATGSMPTSLANQSATLLRTGQVLLVGGCDSSRCATITASAMLYDPRTGTWTTTGSLHRARWGQTATLLPDGDVLVAGGNHTSSPGTILASAELYDPETGAWTATGSMHIARAFGAATLLSGGQVLVAGGCGSCPADVLASAELYNPKTGAWTLTGAMHAPRNGQALASLPNGRILVVGGWDNAGLVASAEIYHPHTGSWAGTGSLHGPRAAMTATRLLSGQILVVGGYTDHVLAGAELYQP